MQVAISLTLTSDRSRRTTAAVAREGLGACEVPPGSRVRVGGSARREDPSLTLMKTSASSDDVDSHAFPETEPPVGVQRLVGESLPIPETSGMRVLLQSGVKHDQFVLVQGR